MGRWIERRRKHQKMASRFQATWGWPHNIWFVLWVFLLFATFFPRLAMIWGLIHGNFSSNAFSTLAESTAFARAYDALERLPNPNALARSAAELQDYRLIDWQALYIERRKGTIWWFTPWPVRQEVGPIVEDISFKISEGAAQLCGDERVGAYYSYTDTLEPSWQTGSHFIDDVSGFCDAVRSFNDSAFVLEERGYNGSGPYIPREALAFYVRFMGYMHAYNVALMKHPNAPQALKTELYYRLKYRYLDYELFYRDWLFRRVPMDLYEQWATW